jgi:isopenicillin-N epimerase
MMTNMPKYSNYAKHWSLDPNIVFLNHGSFGATPVEVLEKQSEYRKLMEHEPVYYFMELMPELYDKSKRSLSKFLGANQDDLVFVQNTTTGVNQVLNSFPAMPGDEWLVSSHAYGACRNAMEHYATKNNIRLQVAEIPFPFENDEDILRAIEEKINKNTRLALIDHISSATGFIFPVKKIIELLHSKGVKVLLDGAHAPGMIDVNIPETGADFYIGNCHKWLCAPKGSAFMYVKEEYRDMIKPLVISHFNDTDLHGKSHWSNQFMWDGTHDFSQYFCVMEAIEFMNSIHPEGWKGIMKHNHRLAWKAACMISEKTGFDLPVSEKYIGSMVTIPVPDGEEGFPKFNENPPLKRKLLEKYLIQIPVFTFPDAPQQWIRISTQLYNSFEQYEYLGECLVKEFQCN